MTLGEYERQLRRLRGVAGPMGEMRQPDGRFKLVYKLPDGSKKYLSPPQDLTEAQRAEVIAELRRHLGIASDDPDDG